MLDYILCVLYLIFCWVGSIYLIGCYLITGAPNLFQNKLEFQVFFDCYFIVNGIASDIRSYVESEFKRMLPICRETQGSREEFKILEIGAGTGANFIYYPKRNLVTIVDNNPYYQPYRTRSLYKNRHVNVEKVLTTSAENMNDVPSGSMDCVVSTYTLCAVDNVDAVLKEVKRVLRTGGCFLFVEPVCDSENIINLFFQRAVYPLIKFFGGYDLRRSLFGNIKANFTNVEASRFDTESELCFRPHIHGIAVK